MPLDNGLREAVIKAASEEQNIPSPGVVPYPAMPEEAPAVTEQPKEPTPEKTEQPEEDPAPQRVQNADTEKEREGLRGLSERLLTALEESGSLNRKLLEALGQSGEIAAEVKKLIGQTEGLPAAVKELGEKQSKNDRQLAQYIRENANFQVQVRQGMQAELEELRKEQKGEQFTPMLRELADLYSVYYPLLLADSPADQLRKNILAMFEQLEDLLSDHEALICVSPVGTERRTRVSKIIKKIPTADKEKHNTIARSIRPGVVKGKLVLSEEYIDVYVYDEKLAQAEEAAKAESVTEAAETAMMTEAEPEPAEEAALEAPASETAAAAEEAPESTEIMDGVETTKDCAAENNQPQAK